MHTWMGSWLVAYAFRRECIVEDFVQLVLFKSSTEPVLLLLDQVGTRSNETYP